MFCPLSLLADGTANFLLPSVLLFVTGPSEITGAAVSHLPLSMGCLEVLFVQLETVGGG